MTHGIMVGRLGDGHHMRYSLSKRFRASVENETQEALG